MRSLLLLLVAAAVLPFLVLLAYNIWADARHNVEQTKANLLHVSEEIARRNGELLAQLKEQLLALAQRPKVANLDPADCDAMIAEAKFLLPRLANVLTLDAAGNLVCSAVPPVAGRPRAVDPWYFLDELRRTRTFTIGTPAKGFVTGRWVVTLAQPILGPDGELRGVVGMAIDLLSFWTGPNALVPLPGGRVRIFDEGGQFVASSDDPQRWVGDTARSIVYAQVVTQQHGTLREFDRFGEARLYGHAAIPGTRWHAVASVPEARVLSATRGEVLVSFVAALAASAVATLLAFLVARAIARPVERTADTVTAVTAGDLAARVPISGPREVAQMAGQFNAMLERLEHSRREIESLARRYETLLQDARDVILVSDGTGTIVEANAAAVDAYGYTIDEMRALSLADLCTVPRRAEAVAAWERASGTEGTLFESEHQRADGSTFPVEVSARSLPIDGRLTVLSSVRDISVRRKAEATLRAAKDAADAASMAKSEFLANMSHEIRTPLNSILGLAQLLEATVSGDESREMLGRIGTAGTLLLRTLNDVLDLSKMEAGQLKIEVQPFRVGTLLRHVVDLVESGPGGKSGAIQVDAEDCDRLYLLGDAVRLEQVLLNLLTNAVKFSDGAEVVLHATARPAGEAATRLRFEVHDRGIGIPADKLASLFTPFTQVESGLARRFGGMGLGLSICRRLVELMGGVIAVDSELGVGSTFWFEVELDRAIEPVPSGAPAGARRQRSAPALAGCRVLVVDDSPMNLDLVARVLRREGAQATLAPDGLKALELLGEDPRAFDLVLMDLQMPVVDGLAATRALRSDPELARLPVIAWSAGVFDEDRAMAMSAGADDFVAKPFDLEQLVEVLVRWTQGRGGVPATRDPGKPASPGLANDPAEAAASLPEIAGIDRTQVERLLGRHSDALLELLASFVELHADAPTRIGTALARGDRLQAAALLHQLRGTAAYIGATRIVTTARALEDTVRVADADWTNAKDEFDAAVMTLVTAARVALAPRPDPSGDQAGSVG